MGLSLLKTALIFAGQLLKLVPLWLASQAAKFKERSKNNRRQIDAQKDYRSRRNDARRTVNSRLSDAIDRVRKAKRNDKR